MKKIVGACAISILLCGCYSQEGEDYPVIGFLKTNEHTIALQLGPSEPLYTVRTNKGRVIGTNLTESELLAKLPQLKSVIEKGLADDASLSLELQVKQD